jgi:hypothetical protein
MWNLVVRWVEIKIWRCGRVRIKKLVGGLVVPPGGMFKINKKNKAVKLGVCRPQKHPITTNLFPNSNIIETVRLPPIPGKKTHSWGKIAVKI